MKKIWNRSKKKLLFVILPICTVIIAGVCIFKQASGDLPAFSYIDNDFESEVAKAIDRYHAGSAADIISGTDTDENAIALIFAGMTDLDTMYAAIDIVKKYDITCTFFLQGAEVAEYPQIVSDIQDTSNEVGSFTLRGNKYMDELPAYEIIDDFVYSSKLIERAAGSYPRYLLCNNTRYTMNLLKSAAASGYDYVVDATQILNYQSFSSYEMAYNYITRLSGGEILEIKMNGVLDEEEYTLPEKEQDVGKESGIDGNQDKNMLSEKERLLLVIEWVCKALKETGWGTVTLNVLPTLPPIVSVDTPQIIPTPVPELTLTPIPDTSGNNTIDYTFNPEKSRIERLAAESKTLLAENAGRLVKPKKLEPGSDKAFCYTFFGISNKAALNNTLQQLKDSHTAGIFFVSDEDILNHPDSIRQIADEGHQIGIALLPKRSATAADAVISLLSIYNYLLQDFDILTTQVIVPFGRVTDEMKEAVSASRMRLIEYDTAVVRSVDEFAAGTGHILRDLFGDTMTALKYGSNVFFRLDFYKSSSTLVSELMGKIMIHEKTLLGIKKLKVNNSGHLTEAINQVYTVERALSYVFYGIENEAALHNVLYQLDKINSTGTFFVTAQDINNYPERISAIINAGHELGIGLLQRDDWDFMDAAVVLSGTHMLLSQQYGIESKLVMLPFGKAGKTVKEAVSALGMTLILPTLSVIRTADEYAVSADEVLQAGFGDSLTTLKRGNIVYFRLDYNKASNTLAGDLVLRIKERFIDPVAYPHDNGGDSAYVIKGAASLISNASLLYQYPMQDEMLMPEIAGVLYPGQLDGMNDDEIFDVIRKGYIGNPDISKSNMLPGFSDEQIELIDKTGKINTNGKNTVFLTFDDWGNDIQINHLLYVLKKHNIKASFFIRTGYVPSNPNLLRAIAADGHDICSHTVNHMALAHFEPEEYVYSSLLEDETVLLRTELIESYRTLLSIAGDVKNEKGFPVIQRYFRAPTLAQSYNGAKTVFDCGYLYSISGDFSTGDYQAASAEELKNILDNGIILPNSSDNRRIEDGSIVVMHMTPDAMYTAEALDMFLTENALKPENEQLHFARLSDFLQK